MSDLQNRAAHLTEEVVVGRMLLTIMTYRIRKLMHEAAAKNGIANKMLYSPQMAAEILQEVARTEPMIERLIKNTGQPPQAIARAILHGI